MMLDTEALATLMSDNMASNHSRMKFARNQSAIGFSKGLTALASSTTRYEK